MDTDILTRLRTKYREINIQLGKTGAGLTLEEVFVNPELANILRM
jgi:hypothetical protein